jgi:hypothetical protein
MKIARLVGVLLIAVFALSAVAASTAFAAEPEFKVLPSVKTFKTTSGAGTLKAGSIATTTCAADSSGGEITGMTTVGKVKVTFTGCKISGNSKVCTAKSVGAKEGEIVTNTLKGSLGTTTTGTDVGLLLEPETTKKFVTLAATSCAIETSVEGGIIGEISPVNISSKTGKLSYTTSGGAQGIKKIIVAGNEVETNLAAFGLVEVTEETSDLQEFGGLTEVS